MADNTLPRGFIFDMDVILVDSEEYIPKSACLNKLVTDLYAVITLYLVKEHIVKLWDTSSLADGRMDTLLFCW